MSDDGITPDDGPVEEDLGVEHFDDPTSATTLPDGTLVRNLSAAEYQARFDDPGLTLHGPDNGVDDDESDPDEEQNR